VSRKPNGARGPGSTLLGPRIAAVAVVALGALVLYESFQIPRGGGYVAVGPRFFPLLIAIGLLLFGALFLLRTTLLPDRALAERTREEEAATHWPTVGVLALLLVLYAFALDALGYVAATALFFPLAARGLGSRRIVRDLLVGLVLAVVVYEGFTRYLGVRLPSGILAPLL
jgi:putative tricarboxylic transport membrane protein